MLKLSFSQEEIEKALADDLMLRHLVRDRWFSFPVLQSASGQDKPLPNSVNPRPINWQRWPQSESRDS